MAGKCITKYIEQMNNTLLSFDFHEVTTMLATLFGLFLSDSPAAAAVTTSVRGKEMAIGILLSGRRNDEANNC